MKAAKAGRSKPKTEPRQTKTDQEQPKTAQDTAKDRGRVTASTAMTRPRHPEAAAPLSLAYRSTSCTRPQGIGSGTLPTKAPSTMLSKPEKTH